MFRPWPFWSQGSPGILRRVDPANGGAEFMDLVVVPDWILRVGFLRRRTCRDLGARVRGLRALCCELLHF